MNTTFAPTRAIGVAKAYAAPRLPILNSGPRILDAIQRKMAKGLACFPEHAKAVVDHLAPYATRNLLDKELADILKAARKTVAFSTKKVEAKALAH